MKVLHILNELRYSGAEVMLEISNKYFLSENIDNHILSTGSELGDYSINLKESGFNIHHIPLKKNFSFFLKYYRFLKNEKFDLIHIHTERANFWYSLVAFFSGNRKQIRTVHHIFYFDGFLKMIKKIQRHIMNKYLGVVSVSNSISGMKNELERYHIKNILISNWYDENQFQPVDYNRKLEIRKSYKIEDNQFIIVSVGGNTSYKNYPILIESLNYLPEKFNYKYIHIGDLGENDELQLLTEKLSLKNKIEFKGKLKSVIDYLHLADVFLMPSSTEGFGVAAVEAMASGCPVILSYVPALKDFKSICDNIIYTEIDPIAIANKIKLLGKKSLNDRHKIGMKLSKCIYEEYASSKVVPKYIELYKNVICIN